jgi:hypothetical protein
MAMAEVRGDGMIETKTYCDVCKKEVNKDYYIFEIRHIRPADGIFRGAYFHECKDCLAKTFPEEIRATIYKELK